MSYKKSYQVITAHGEILTAEGIAKFDQMNSTGQILDIRQTVDYVEEQNVQIVQGYIEFDTEASANEYFDYITDHFVDLKEVVKFG